LKFKNTLCLGLKEEIDDLSQGRDLAGMRVCDVSLNE
jgi:hypothetical protein